MVASSTTTVVTKETYTADFSAAVWHRPKCDGEHGGAVEVAFAGDLVAVREELEPGKEAGPVLIFTADEWDAFVAGAKDGEFDLD